MKIKVINRFAAVGITSTYDHEKQEEWNCDEYKIIRNTLEILGYNVLQISLVGHIWHKAHYNPFVQDKEELRMYFNIAGKKIILIPGSQAGKEFRIESSTQLVNDINYYFGKGNLDY